MARLKQDEKAFLLAHNLDPKAYSATGLAWPALLDIRAHHVFQLPSLTSTGRYITERLTDVVGVHSLKMRIKDPDHLVAKIIRKSIQRPRTNITLQNYSKKITDLIGIRALHLFKEDWQPIHTAISHLWDLKERPIAYVRKGDSDVLAERFRASNCRVTEHQYGYRSVHYLDQSKLEKTPATAEIQVRTLFEEGWSEIDHQIRYPNDIANPIFADFLVIFNRLAGSADEIGSFIRFLKTHMAVREVQNREEKAAYNEQINSLKAEIAELAINRKEKQELEKRLSALSQAGARTIVGGSAVTYSFTPVLGKAITINADTMMKNQAAANAGLSLAYRQGLESLQSSLAVIQASKQTTPGVSALQSALLSGNIISTMPSSGKTPDK
jgi:putative GTP pyrophosphokinase